MLRALKNKQSLFIALFFFLSLCPGCQKHQQDIPYKAPIQQKITPPRHATEHHLVVFIHGTLLPFPSLKCFASTFGKIVKHRCPENKSWYQLYLDELKCKSIFKYQPNGPDGLCPVDKNSSLLAQVATEYFTNFYKERHPHTPLSCYTFGWSGRLSQKKRLQAAYDLYTQLMREVQKFSVTKITLFGHSHGGNVVLNLARAEEKFHQNLIIDKAILLGTPIQSETQSLLESPIFTSIYNCYSHGDKIQKIDFVSTRDDYSQRRFTTTPDKLTQIELQLGTNKPGHGELWLQWGKKNIVYRKKLPIFPLPAFFFLPEIIQRLESLKPKQQNVTVNIDQKNSNYTVAVYRAESNIKKYHQQLSCLTLPKQTFSPYIKTLLQREQAKKTIT